ncbi:hypothetical protein JXA12_01770 [Candidatus Woesearchaeota archaeon]|nr:hypothetical protein [Candidatus Woesearchaeota archaeon]
MIAKNFNDDMDEYLSRVYGKKERYVDTVKKRKRPVEERVPELSEEEVYVEYDNARPGVGVREWLASLFSRRIPDEALSDDVPPAEAAELESMEDELEEVSEEIEELEDRRESLWERFMNRLRWPGRESKDELKDELLEEVVPVIDEDVKETLKLLHSWLERLPRGEMQAFKRSDDFQRYKATLEKYGLIKKE